MDTNFVTLNIDRPRAHVTLVTLNRPASANAMNSRLGTEIMTLFESLNLDSRTSGGRRYAALADLNRRLASGEIERAEYEEKRKSAGKIRRRQKRRQKAEEAK
jgi:enoyl-CoA hydratase/carnithine racemase